MCRYRLKNTMLNNTVSDCTKENSIWLRSFESTNKAEEHMY